jgi:hypothetical protein
VTLLGENRASRKIFRTAKSGARGPEADGCGDEPRGRPGKLGRMQRARNVPSVMDERGAVVAAPGP